MKSIFSCLYGSKLYGTSTPASDRDVKHVVLPSLDDLLVGKKVTNTVKKTNNERNAKNTSDDVDEEFIPIQVFARDFMMGQTYALELAFALEGNRAEQTFYWPSGNKMDREIAGGSPFFEFVRDLRTKFLTSNIKAMMGYVVNQASLYSFKGERLNVSREFRDLLSMESCVFGDEATIADVYASPDGRFSVMTEALSEKHPKYFKKTEYDIGGGRMRPCFVLLEKTFPFTNEVGHSLGVADALIKKYGTRADRASATNVDWKATMHALRIVDEGLRILGCHSLEFPFDEEYSGKLLSIKRGEIPLEDVTRELTNKLDRLKVLERETTLPPYSQEMQREFDHWLAHWMKRFYAI